MAEIKTYRCDVDGVVMKGEEGGWFRYYHDAGAVLVITTWDVEMDEETDLSFMGARLSTGHLCSEGCAAKMLSRAIGAGVASTPSVLTVDEEAFLRA